MPRALLRHVTPAANDPAINNPLINRSCYLQKIMYMWSRNGSGVEFPPDSGMTIGKDAGINILVLQVHYVTNEHITKEGETKDMLVFCFWLFVTYVLLLQVTVLAC